MKSLKYIIVSLVLAVGFAAPSMNAQADGKSRPGQGGGGDMYAPLLKGITLTAEQQTKIDAIKADAQKQAQGLSQEERRTKGREIRTAASDKIRAALTAEQQKKFDANRKEIESQRAGGGNKGGDKNKGGGKPGKGGGKGGAGE